jgi:hypothetical protein
MYVLRARQTASVVQVPYGSYGIPVWWPLRIWDVDLCFGVTDLKKIWTAMQQYYGIEELKYEYEIGWNPPMEEHIF